MTSCKRVPLVNHLQRELNLSRRSRGLADDSEPAAPHNVRRQSKIDNIEDVEELRSEFQRSQLCVSAMSERRVFNQRNVEVMESRPAKRIPPQSTEASLVGPGTARHIDWDGKERWIPPGPQSEIIVAHGAAGGQVRHRNQVGTITTAEARTRLLSSRKHGERRSCGQRRNVQ